MQVDEASLRSVLDVDLDDKYDEDWVNLVRCQEVTDYDHSAETRKEQEEYARQLPEDGDELATEDWIMMATGSIRMGTYACLSGSTEDWHCFYSAPPNFVIFEKVVGTCKESQLY